MNKSEIESRIANFREATAEERTAADHPGTAFGAVQTAPGEHFWGEGGH